MANEAVEKVFPYEQYNIICEEIDISLVSLYRPWRMPDCRHAIWQD